MDLAHPITTTSELADALDHVLDVPIVCVDLDGIGSGFLVSHDLTRPFVIVGVSRIPESSAPEWVDVALHVSDTAQPWIHVRDLGAALEDLYLAVKINPTAAVVATQVLRATDPHNAGRSLMIESLAYGMLQSGPEHRSWLQRTVRRSGSDGELDGPDLTLVRTDHELVITLNRPTRRNAYRARTRDELVEALELAVLDPTITAVHLRGAGPSFSSGGDLGEFGSVADGAGGHMIRSTRNAASGLAHLEGRTVAHLQGPCLGAGVELSAACATVEATTDTTLALPEVAMGLIPGAGGTWSVPRRIGRGRATWLALTGVALTAGQAHQWGLIDRIVDDLDVVETVAP